MRLKSCRRGIGVLVVWAAVLPVFALDTLSLLGEGPARQLLQGKKAIRAETDGRVPVGFDQALAVLSQSNLLDRIQREYRELLAENETPEFIINQTSSNTYFYVNQKGERTDLVELLRQPASDGAFDIVLYSAGNRFFGYYQAVIHIRLFSNGTGGSNYQAVVYAYPENAFSRFFARHFNLVERYFAKKTGQMAGIVTAIGCSLCGKEAGIRPLQRH